MWWKNKAKKQNQVDHELTQLQKVRESQVALINAATSTADVAHDVTSIMKSRLNDSLMQLEQTAQMLGDALITCDDKGNILTLNYAAERIFGWDVALAKDKSVEILFRNNDGSHIEFDALLQVMMSSQDVNDSFDLDSPLDSLRGKRRSGELFWVDVHLSSLQRFDGSLQYMLLARDTTTRVETLRMLKINEERYRSIFEYSFDGILVVSNHHIVAANPAISAMLGYTQDQLIAKPLKMFVHSDYHRVVNIESTVRQSGDLSPKNYVIKCLGVSGNEITFLISSTGMQWGDSVANLIFFKDIADLQ